MKNESGSAQRPWRLLFIAIAAIWGSSFLFMKGAALELGVWPTACLRMAIGAIFLLPLLAAKGLLGEMKKDLALMSWISLVNAAIPFACYSFAVLHITTGLSAILNATTPMLTALVAWWWLGKTVSRSRLIGVMLGFIGVALLVSEQAMVKSDAKWLAVSAIAACLVATSCYAVAGNVVKEKMAHKHPWTLAFGTMFGAAGWLAIPAALTWPTTPVSATAWLSVVMAGVFCSAVALMLYFELMQRTDMARTASVTYLIPVFAIVYSVLFLNEPVTWWMLVCGLLVVAGTALATGWRQNDKSGNH